jgi:hypothetical protein
VSCSGACVALALQPAPQEIFGPRNHAEGRPGWLKGHVEEARPNGIGPRYLPKSGVNGRSEIFFDWGCIGFRYPIHYFLRRCRALCLMPLSRSIDLGEPAERSAFPPPGSPYPRGLRGTYPCLSLEAYQRKPPPAGRLPRFKHRLARPRRSASEAARRSRPMQRVGLRDVRYARLDRRGYATPGSVSTLTSAGRSAESARSSAPRSCSGRSTSSPSQPSASPTRS